jgi:hypothetical protein
MTSRRRRFLILSYAASLIVSFVLLRPYVVVVESTEIYFKGTSHLDFEHAERHGATARIAERGEWFTLTFSEFARFREWVDEESGDESEWHPTAHRTAQYIEIYEPLFPFQPRLISSDRIHAAPLGPVMQRLAWITICAGFVCFVLVVLGSRASQPAGTESAPGPQPRSDRDSTGK